jgi:hypothetical protein
MTMRTVNRLLCAAAAAVLSVGSLLAQGASVPSPAKGTGEDIKVHGHWVIEIRNADGSLAARHEFENSLHPTYGVMIMAAVLGGVLPPLAWEIGVADVSGASPCVIQSEGQTFVTDCTSVSPGSGSQSSDQFPTLAVTIPTDTRGVPTGRIQLAGSITVTNPAATSYISEVSTARLLDTSRLPNFGYPSGWFELTFHQIDRLAVHPNQIINVVVTLSFS